MNFKVGDKVRVIDTQGMEANIEIGDIFEVLEEDDTPYCKPIKSECKDEMFALKQSRLELVEEISNECEIDYDWEDEENFIERYVDAEELVEGTKFVSIDDNYDVVNNPRHYTEGRKYQPIDVITDWDLNFSLGNAIKYISRAGRKDDILQDLEKAKFYLDYEINRLKNNK